MAYLTGEDRVRLDAFKAVTVKHAHLQEVNDQLSLWVEEHTDATHVLLCGPGGVGKSKVLTVVAERFTREESDRFVVPILLLEPIPPDQGPYLRLDYYWQIIALLRKPANAENGETTRGQGSVPGVPPLTEPEQEAEPVSATSPLPQVTPKSTKPSVGQRAPERDPVGETSILSVRKTTGCSFTEDISVTPAQMEEAGVSRFECPTCLAVRDIKPKGGGVKFPWHPKRTTNAPNHGLRWIQKESIWRPSDKTM